MGAVKDAMDHAEFREYLWQYAQFKRELCRAEMTPEKYEEAIIRFCEAEKI